jgi:hypothetical protein
LAFPFHASVCEGVPTGRTTMSRVARSASFRQLEQAAWRADVRELRLFRGLPNLTVSYQFLVARSWRIRSALAWRV